MQMVLRKVKNLKLAVTLFELGYPEARVEEAIKRCKSVEEAVELLCEEDEQEAQQAAPSPAASSSSKAKPERLRVNGRFVSAPPSAASPSDVGSAGSSKAGARRSPGQGTKVKEEPAAKGTKVKVEPAARGAKVKAEPSPKGTKVKEEPSPKGTKVKAEPAARGTKVKDEPSPQGTKVKAEPASRGTKVKAEPATQGAKVKVEPVTPQAKRRRTSGSTYATSPGSRDAVASVACTGRRSEGSGSRAPARRISQKSPPQQPGCLVPVKLEGEPSRAGSNDNAAVRCAVPTWVTSAGFGEGSVGVVAADPPCTAPDTASSAVKLLDATEWWQSRREMFWQQVAAVRAGLEVLLISDDWGANPAASAGGA